MKRLMLHTALGVSLLAGGSTVAAQQQNRDRSRDDRESQQRQQDRDYDQRQRDRDTDRRQRDRDDDETDRRERDRDLDRSSRSERQHRDHRQSQSRDQRSTFLVPSGWVTIGTDRNNDGRFENTETIFYYDLVEARRSSQERRRQEDARRGDRQHSQHEQTVQLRGTIEDTHKSNLRGHDGKAESHVFAKIDTENRGTERVCLGPKSKISKLNLSEGDEVSIKAERHRVNNRPILMATHVEADGQSVKIERMKSDKANRVRGTIESLNRRSFRGRDGQFVVGDVELQSGRMTSVIFGPESKLERLDLQEGDEIRVMAREGRLNGETALVAAEIHANGETVTIPKSRRVSGQRSSNRDRDQQRDRNQKRDDRTASSRN